MAGSPQLWSRRFLDVSLWMSAPPGISSEGQEKRFPPPLLRSPGGRGCTAQLAVLDDDTPPPPPLIISSDHATSLGRKRPVSPPIQ